MQRKAIMDQQQRRYLKFGLICLSEKLSDWQADCLSRVLSIEDVEFAVVLTATHADFQETIAEAWKGASGPPIVNLADIVGNVAIISTNPVRNVDGSLSFAYQDLTQLESHDLDFILYLGSARINGGILNAARCGVWAFSHGAGFPAAYWEVYNGSAVTCASLHRLAESSENAVTLRKGCFKTANSSYPANLEQVLTESARWLGQVCRDMQNGADQYIHASPAKTDLTPPAIPTRLQSLGFFVRTKFNKLINLKRHLTRHRHWGLAVAMVSAKDLLAEKGPTEITFLPRPSRSTFHADSFGMNCDDGLAILYEDCLNNDIVGEIGSFVLSRAALAGTAGAISKSDCRFVPVNIRFPHHTSYPYIFSHGGTYFCVPETSEAAKVSLFKCVSAPGEWEHVADLITGFPAVDSSVVYYEGRWWLFCTNLDDNPNSHLYIWHADDLLGPWRPHGNNPVKMDITSARPAGTLFKHGGNLYRPAQDCSRDYGGSVTLQRVTELSPVSFSEQPHRGFEHLMRAHNLDGMHTISMVGDVMVLDYFKYTFLLDKFRYRLRMYLNSKLKR